MKVTVIITTMMVAQVSSSFLEVFQGAVLSVQNSFGKLFSDVVTDVKDTVDCTILAVEHILSLSEDATARYYKKCASAKNDSQNDSQQKNNFPVLEIAIANNEEYLKKELPEEIDARINATLLKILNGYNPHDKLEAIQKELAKETERLADVSNLVKQELEKLSKEIHIDFTNVERKDYKPSVDSILNELKVLEVIEHNLRNSSEANKIHRLVGDVLNKLHLIESSGAKQNDKIDGIVRDLERSSNKSYKDIRQQLEDWKAEEARHLNVIKLKMDEHENVPKHLEYAKMDNTFTTIERPKNVLLPIENEISSRTIPLNSKNTIESMLPNIVTKHISSTPKIAIQPSFDATNPVQINDASGVLTPVSISTNSYVNEINVDLTETLIPQRFKEPIVNHMPDKTLDFTTPITFVEKSLNSTNLGSIQPTIELLKRSWKDGISHSVIIPEATSFVSNNILELSAQPSVLTIESNTSTNKTLERDTSVQIAIPQISTYQSSSNTYLGRNLDFLNTTTSPTISENSHNPTTGSESTIHNLVTANGSSTNPATTTDLPEISGSTINSVMSLVPATSLLVTAIDADKRSTTNPVQTKSITMMAPELTTRFTMPSEFSTDLLLKAPESTTSLKVIPEPSTYPSMTTIVHNTSPTMTPEPTRHIPVTAAQSAISSEVSLESTLKTLVTTNPVTTPGFSMNPEVTDTEKVIKSLMMSTSTINIPKMTTDSTTNPTMIQDSNTSLPVMASKLINISMKPKPTTNPLLTSPESTTNLTTILELPTHLPLKTPETELGMISELTTDLPVMTSESPIPTKTSEPIPNISMIYSDVTTETKNTLPTIKCIPVTIPRPKSSVRILEPIRNFPFTVPEPTIKSTGTPKLTTKSPRTTTEFTTYHLVKTTDIRTKTHVTSHSPKIIPEATTNLTATVRGSTNRLATNHLILDTYISVSAFNTSSSITPEPIIYRSVSTSQEPISTSHTKSGEPSEAIMGSTETMTKSTTDLSRATLKSVTKNLSNLQRRFNLPTHRPEVSTPSLKAFLNYIDRKESFTRPHIQFTRMTTTGATPIGADNKILSLTPRLYSKPRSTIKSSPINAKLNAFFSHLSPQNISSSYARSDYAIPVDGTVLGVLGVTSPKIKHDMPHTTSLNKNAHPKPLSLSHLTPMMPYNPSPYGGKNITPLGKGMPQKRHILPQRRNYQNTPIKPHVRLPTNLSRSLGLTTNKPVPTPKINHYDDFDYKSFFHNSFDSEAQSRALNEAKKIIEDSKRGHRIINNIFNIKNKEPCFLNCMYKNNSLELSS